MYSELFRCVVMILVASLGIESAFSHDWQIARATLLDAAQCSESIPSADMVIDMKVGAASNDRFADRLIHYHVITDWERAFVQWKETRARDQDMPTIYSEWSFDGTVKRCNPFSPDRSYVANDATRCRSAERAR